MRILTRMAVVAASMVVLTGCTGDGAQAENHIADLPAATVVEKSLAALKAVPSYRVGIHRDKAESRLSITVAVVGTNLRGTVARGEASSEILKVGANYYFRPDEAFWRTVIDEPKRADAYAAFAGDRWIRVEKDHNLLKTAGLDGVYLFAERNALNGVIPAQMSLGERKEVGGVPTVTVLDSRNSTPSGTRISVATTGEPYPVRWDFGLGTVADFTGFGTTSDPIDEPVPADIVALQTVLRSK